MTSSTALKLATWNLNARQKCLPDQVAFLRSLDADVVLLQEVTRYTFSRLESLLLEAGYPYVAETVRKASSGPRKYGLVTASRFPITPREHRSVVVWPERLQCLTVQAPAAEFVLMNTHIPPGASNGWIKVEMLEACQREASQATLPLILGGDFNAPQVEFEGGVSTWAQRQRRDESWHLIKSRGQRWDEAERQFFQPPWVDAYRSVHGLDDSFSWMLINRGRPFPRRFDHFFLQGDWVVKSALYHVNAIESRLSDHVPLVVEVEVNRE